MGDKNAPNFPASVVYPPSPGQASFERPPARQLSPKKLTTPKLSRRDPSLPAPSTTSKTITLDPEHTENPKIPWTTNFKHFIYDERDKTYCYRTCGSWAKIIIYAIMYIIFLTTYTMFFLYFSLLWIKTKNSEEFSKEPTVTLLTYSVDNIGLSGIPLAEHSYPLIWYRTGETTDYDRYVTAIDELLKKKREKRDLGSNLGPCGVRPYGYGEQPCIFIKINKQLSWFGKPLTPGSPKAILAPVEVQKWVQEDSKKYWLHCSGYHNYDKEHIGKIRYYPDPPGFDSTLFPLKANSTSPMVAIQVTNFTLGISVAIECKLWFEKGSSSIAFMLYVSPKSRISRNASRW